MPYSCGSSAAVECTAARTSSLVSLQILIVDGSALHMQIASNEVQVPNVHFGMKTSRHHEKCAIRVWKAAKSRCWDPVTSAAYVIMLFAAAGSNLPPRMSSHT